MVFFFKEPRVHSLCCSPCVAATRTPVPVPFFLWEKTKRQHHTDPTANLDEVSCPRASVPLLPLPHKTHRKEGKNAHGSAPAD